MKILIVNAYLRNNGDAALLSVLITQLRRAWPAAEVVISSLEDPESYPTFDACVNIGSISTYTAAADVHKLRRMLRKLLALIVETLWPRLPQSLRRTVTRTLPSLISHELDAIETADIVISTGGGYLNGVNSLGGNLNVRYVLLALKLAEKIHKPVIFGPQSFGPFGNTHQEKMVKKVVAASQCALVREDNSFNLLVSIGVDKKILKRAVDSGFAFDTQTAGSTRNHKKMNIGMTARLWYGDEKQQAYEAALANFIIAAQTAHTAEVHLIPQVTSDFEEDDDDRYTEREIAKVVQAKGGTVDQIDTPLDHHEIKKVYDALDFTVGTRFHSVIFSLTSYVPAIAIEYEHKTSGIMKDLGLGDWVIKIDDVTAEKLIEIFERLVREREQYVRHLHKVLPPYINKANESGRIIRQVYEQFVDAGNDARR